VIQNLVLNNSDHNFSVPSAQLQAAADQPKVVATPGTPTAVAASLRAQLEAGTLTSSGQGINAEFSA
jgi:hypothetical protein